MKKLGKKRPLVGLLFRTVVRILSCLSLKWTHRLGTFIGWGLWCFPNSLKKISTDNIRIAFPHLSVEERRKLVKSSLIELGKGFCELGPLWCWPRERLLPLVDDNGGRDAIDRALGHGKGVIVLSPHLGAWELTGWYASLFYPTTSLYRPPRVGSITEFMNKVRQRDGARLVPTDVVGIKALFRALKNNEVVGILPDQDPGSSGGAVAPFFGHPANTMTLISKLAQKSGANILFSFAERLPNGNGFAIRIIKGQEEIGASDVTVAATALNHQIEQCVLQAPSQYLWSYKRYKR